MRAVAPSMSARYAGRPWSMGAFFRLAAWVGFCAEWAKCMNTHARRRLAYFHMWYWRCILYCTGRASVALRDGLVVDLPNRLRNEE
jgi:hypothetical protein